MRQVWNLGLVNILNLRKAGDGPPESLEANASKPLLNNLTSTDKQTASLQQSCFCHIQPMVAGDQAQAPGLHHGAVTETCSGLKLCWSRMGAVQVCSHPVLFLSRINVSINKETGSWL